jgi:hypothetical protein
VTVPTFSSVAMGNLRGDAYLMAPAVRPET